MASEGSLSNQQAARAEDHGARTKAGSALGLWLLLRVVTSALAAAVSPIRPILEREGRIPLWPPSAPLAAWLERVLLAPWERRDAIYYIRIAVRGYRVDDGTAQFHPLFSWLAAPLARLSGQPLLLLLLVSSTAAALLAVAFLRLAEMDLEPARAWGAMALLMLAPPAFVLFAPYPEGLFLLCAVGCFLAMRRRRWWLAGLAGALATLTRQQGIFLALPVAWELWDAGGRRWRAVLRGWRDWLALALIPAGYAGWLAYRGVALGDLQPDFGSVQSLFYSILVSPSAFRVVPMQALLWPWQSLWLAIRKLLAAPEYSLIIDLGLAAGFLLILALAWRNLRASYRIYALAITLMSFSYHTGPFYPYMGLPRHLLLAFPVFVGLGARLHGPRLRLIVALVSLLGLLFLLFQYVIEGWVP